MVPETTVLPLDDRAMIITFITSLLWSHYTARIYERFKSLTPIHSLHNVDYPTLRRHSPSSNVSSIIPVFFILTSRRKTIAACHGQSPRVRLRCATNRFINTVWDTTATTASFGSLSRLVRAATIRRRNARYDSPVLVSPTNQKV